MLVSQRDLGSKFTRATNCLFSDSSIAISFPARAMRSFALSVSRGYPASVLPVSRFSVRSTQVASPAHCYRRFVHAAPALFDHRRYSRSVNSVDSVASIETRHTRNLAIQLHVMPCCVSLSE